MRHCLRALLTIVLTLPQPALAEDTAAQIAYRQGSVHFKARDFGLPAPVPATSR
jgi:hypothetical protein